MNANKNILQRLRLDLRRRINAVASTKYVSNPVRTSECRISLFANAGKADAHGCSICWADAAHFGSCFLVGAAKPPPSFETFLLAPAKPTRMGVRIVGADAAHFVKLLSCGRGEAAAQFLRSFLLAPAKPTRMGVRYCEPMQLTLGSCFLVGAAKPPPGMVIPAVHLSVDC